MNKKYIIIGIIVVAVVVAALFFYREKPQDILSVASDDGMVKLEIPQGTLPEGIKAEDISVTRMAEPLLKGAYAGYHLKPNGIQFQQPILITFELPFINGGNVPLLIVANESGLEMVDKTEVVFNRKLNRTTVSGKLAHFSDIYISSMGGIIDDNLPYWHKTSGVFSLDLVLPPPMTLIPVGDVFDVEGYFAIEKRNFVEEYSYGSGDWMATTRFVIRDVHVEGTWRSISGLAPKSTTPSPDEDVIEELEYTEPFQCAFPGIASFDHVLRLQFNLYMESTSRDIDGFLYLSSGDRDTSLLLFFMDNEVSCVEEEKDQGVMIDQPDDAAQPMPPAPEPSADADAVPKPPSAPPAPSDPNEARCLEVCGSDRYFPVTSLEECSDTSEAFLCIQNKQACYNYLIPRGWQTDSSCCCKDEPIVTSADDRIDCVNFKGWGINGYAVDKSPYYPFGESTKSVTECE